MSCHIYARDLLVKIQTNPFWEKVQQSLKRDNYTAIDDGKKLTELFLVYCRSSYDLNFSSVFNKNEARLVAAYLASKKPDAVIRTIGKVVEGRLLPMQEKEKIAKKALVETVKEMNDSNKDVDTDLIQKDLDAFYRSRHYGLEGSLYTFLQATFQKPCHPDWMLQKLTELLDNPDSLETIKKFVDLLKGEEHARLLAHFRRCGDFLAGLAIPYNNWSNVVLKRMNADHYYHRSDLPPIAQPTLDSKWSEAFLEEVKKA
jgi:hypothetical protein